MPSFKLGKSEKLCSKTAIDRLFIEGRGSVSYPLRVVWCYSLRVHGDAVQFLVNVPKRRHRHAVDRVWLRRRVREAYRLNRQPLLDTVQRAGRRIDLALLWLSDDKLDYHAIEKHVCRLLDRVASQITTGDDAGNDLENSDGK